MNSLTTAGVPSVDPLSTTISSHGRSNARARRECKHRASCSQRSRVHMINDRSTLMLGLSSVRIWHFGEGFSSISVASIPHLAPGSLIEAAQDAEAAGRASARGWDSKYCRITMDGKPRMWRSYGIGGGAYHVKLLLRDHEFSLFTQSVHQLRSSYRNPSAR